MLIAQGHATVAPCLPKKKMKMDDSAASLVARANFGINRDTRMTISSVDFQSPWSCAPVRGPRDSSAAGH